MHGSGITVGFEKFTEFETALAQYTGAPHVVLTDCCTHAVELCLRLKGTGIATLPYRSYISIPMTMHKLNIELDLLILGIVLETLIKICIVQTKCSVLVLDIQNV